MPSFEVFPNEGLDKSLVLGTSLFHTVSRLKESHHRLQFAYSPNEYLDTPSLVTLPELGIRLMFSTSKHQSLVLIEVLNFEFLKLTYKGDYLNDIVYQLPSDEELVQVDHAETLEAYKKKIVSPPTLKEIYDRTFGPTFPGELIASSNCYILSYPGIAFRFEIRSEELRSKIAQLSDKNHILSKLTNWDRANDIPCVSLAIFEGEDYQSFIRKLSQTSRLEIAPKSLSRTYDEAIDTIAVTLSTGTAVLKFHSESKRSQAEIRIGRSTQQDILRLLGPPDSYFNKFDSRLLIHKHLRPESRSMRCSSSLYKFHNYFRHGIDFLYNLNPANEDGGVLEKIVLHNGGNIKSLDFMHWEKCHWTIKADDGDDSLSVNSEMYFDEFSKDFLQALHSENSEPVLLNRNATEMTSEYDLEVLSCEDVDGLSATESLGSRVAKNSKTWGQSRLHGYRRCIWEVIESNNCVSCVTIY